jgi:hypothetical protein
MYKIRYSLGTVLFIEICPGTDTYSSKEQEKNHCGNEIDGSKSKDQKPGG